MTSSLVGSEMCIRDSSSEAAGRAASKLPVPVRAAAKLPVPGVQREAAIAWAQGGPTLTESPSAHHT
eukprot:4376946-Prorocentrum_lima.AAC.1